MDEKTAQLLEACEGRLAVAKARLAKGDGRGAKQAFVEAQSLAREAVDAGRAEVTLPATLKALKRWQPHSKGYWSSA